MTYLNAQQLAFILDIKKEDARAKMCVAWSAHIGQENQAERNAKGKIVDPYPIGMPVEILSKHLNIPTLQDSVDDIVSNYLNRPASKKWILCDYPEKQIAKTESSGEVKPIGIPAALKSMLPKETKDIIIREWRSRFPDARINVR
jgi:hypothetical protein